MTGFIEEILVVGLFALGITALLSPLETLGWWAGWFQKRDTIPLEGRELAEAEEEEGDPPPYFVVYLSGIGLISGDALSASDKRFVDSLKQRLPNAEIISDVFPYAASGVGLTGQRMFASFWRLILNLRLDGDKMVAKIVNVRNMYQVLISADSRYGPLYDYGTAKVITRSLVKHGYSLNKPVPIFLLGYSGGGQISVGAASFLSTYAKGNLEVISLGGVIASDPGLDRLAQLNHLFGDKDKTQRLGQIFFPRRWSIFTQSHWNRAIEEKRILFHRIGPMKHNGAGGYLDDKAKSEDGQTFLDATSSAIADIVHQRCETYRISP